MMNPYKKFKIDHLLFTTFGILMVIILGATIWTSYSLTSRELATTASVNQEKLLNELNNEISTKMLTVEQISLSKSRDNAFISFMAGIGGQDPFLRYQKFKEVNQSLASLTNSIPLIQGIDIYMNQPMYGDSQAYIQFHELAEADGQYWAESLNHNDFAWSDEYTIHTAQGSVPVLSFARTLIYSNKMIGYLVIHVKADTLREALTGHSNAEVSRVMLDAAGRPIMHIGKAPEPSVWTEWKPLMTGDSGVLRIQNKGSHSSSLMVYSRIDRSDWTIVELTPWSQITEGSLKLAKAIAVIGAAAIILTLGITMILSRQFTKPIRRLVKAMNHYSVDGNNIPLPNDYRNEFGYLFSGYRKQNERIEELVQSLQQRHEQQRKAELEALQANINPHFLYNTLDQLNWMAITSGQEEMSKILELMGRMFRIGLSNGNTFITVEEEIEHLSCYLEIQLIRTGRKLSFELDVPAEMRSLFLPKMILQPFVENSVVHGFHQRDAGIIKIRMRSSGEYLIIEIEDDGVGLREKEERPVNRKTGGYGIRNVRERITAYFGESFAVDIQPREGGGTRVEITLPRLEERLALGVKAG